MKKETIKISGWRELIDDIALALPPKGYHNATDIAKELSVSHVTVRRSMRILREANKVEAKKCRNPETGYREWYYKQ